MSDEGGREAEKPRQTVLVVDDDPANRLVVRAHLASVYEVIEAEDSRTALTELDRHDVDLVILDVLMPGMSGYDLCRIVKERHAAEYLPVLLITALENQEARTAGLEAGADDFLTKPVDRRELLLRVRSFIRLRRQERTIRHQVTDLRHLQNLNESLFSLIIHDLRNPLGCVEAYIRLAQDELAELAQKTPREYLSRAFKSAHELGGILDEVIKVRMLEQGRLQLDREPIPLRMIVAEAVEAVRASSASLNVRILLEGDGNVIVPVDHNLTLCSLQNLLTNAITFSSADDTVTVKLLSVGQGAAVEIEDQGPGVPDELKGDVFEKYGSVEAWRGQARRGLGLGLHLVKLVAVAHGGSVSVRDSEAGGSVFRLYLPGPRETAAESAAIRSH